MGVGRTNPASGIALKERMTTEALKPVNNGADIPDRDAFLDNLGVTAALADLNALAGLGVTVTVTAVAGAENVSTVTVTVKDAAGATVAAVHHLRLYFSASAVGATVTATDYSGSLVAGTGALIATHTAAKVFDIATAATGIFVGSLTDTAATADYVAVVPPLGGVPVVSAAIAYGAGE